MKYTINANFATEVDAQLGQKRVANKVGACFHSGRKATVKVVGTKVIATGSVKSGTPIGKFAKYADDTLRGKGNYNGVQGYKSCTF